MLNYTTSLKTGYDSPSKSNFLLKKSRRHFTSRSNKLATKKNENKLFNEWKERISSFDLILFSFWMWSGNHLGKIDEDGFLVVVDHDVKLVKVAMDDTIIGQFEQETHKGIVQGTRILQLAQLAPLHENNDKWDSTFVKLDIDRISFTEDSRWRVP